MKMPNKARKKEQNPNWGGGDIAKHCLVCDKSFNVERHRKDTAKYCSGLCKYKRQPGRNRTGKLVKCDICGTETWKKKYYLDLYNKTYCSSKCYGKTITVNVGAKLLRTSNKYAIWRRGIMEIGGYSCCMCGSKEHLHADHIKPLSKYPDLAYDLNNGRILCAECHYKTPTYGIKILSYHE